MNLGVNPEAFTAANLSIIEGGREGGAGPYKESLRLVDNEPQRQNPTGPQEDLEKKNLDIKKSRLYSKLPNIGIMTGRIVVRVLNLDIPESEKHNNNFK